jgi:hypothetical protein
MTLLCVASCHDDYSDYTTTGRILLSLPTDGEIEVIQYSVKMMNLNSRHTITLAGETNKAITIDNLFRGAYSINVEGVVRYVGSDATSHTSQFRAQSDYVSMVELNDNAISLEMILMD